MAKSPAATVSTSTVLNWLRSLGFVQGGAGQEEWTRSFPNPHAYMITVSTQGAGKIDYGPDIDVKRATVTNLKDLENLVVLECICSLLNAGYSPSSLTLEKPFKLGHRAGGFLDILVSNGPKSYLMIECKTDGIEYQSSLVSLKSRHDNQLFTYLQQDGDAQHAVLYSSTCVVAPSGVPEIKRSYAGFSTSTLEGQNTKDLFDSWNQQLYVSGLFESSPYTLKETPLTIADLEDLTKEDGAKLFNSIKEILRRYAVSDKPNAFNKIFNLFVCKIQDEDKQRTDDVTEFQWLSNEDNLSALNRLGDLYERGMREYLDLEIDNHSIEQLDALTKSLSDEQRASVAALFSDARQFNNTDFAFVEVFDKASFEQNARIVRDIVRLLQRKRLRYGEKHSFMGMFFEKLLSTSVKQESGQFFTPTPIAQFICEALPVEAMVECKIKNNDKDFLPYAIDYAAGSGHFLNEFMDRADKVLRTLDSKTFASKAQAENADVWSRGLNWAGEFMYGIELDYRLAKTAKVSTFLNGDGKANVIRGDGLGHFNLDSNYQRCGKKIWKSKADDSRNMPNFDVVVANPPYSVSEFARSTEHLRESFELGEFVTDSSKEIEALFMERTKQLLKPGGVAGLVLPTSFFSNNSLERRARKLTLQHFYVVGLLSLGSRVFGATGTPTTIAFLKRRKDSDAPAVVAGINHFFSKKTDTHILDQQQAFSSYAQDVHGASFDELVAVLENPVDSQLPIFVDYEWAYNNDKSRKTLWPTRDTSNPALPDSQFLKFVHEMERERMEGYFLSFGQRAILINAPEGLTEKKDFLGYDFSERKRHEGLSLMSGTDLIETPLFDPLNADNEHKISTFIKKHFVSPQAAFPPELTQYGQVVDLGELLGLDKMKFVWSIDTSLSDRGPAFLVATERLGTLCDVKIGGTPSRQQPQYFRGNNLWVSIAEMNGDVINDTKEKISDEGVKKSNVKFVEEGTVLLSFKLTIGKIAIAGKGLYTNEAIAALPVKPVPNKDSPWIDRDYLAVLLEFFPAEILQHKGQGRKKIGESLNSGYLNRVRVPVLSELERKAFCATAKDLSLSWTHRRELLRSQIWVGSSLNELEMDDKVMVSI